MKKYQLDMAVKATRRLGSGLLHIVLELPDHGTLPQMLPGQFVEVAVSRANVLLNRPISIFNRTDNTLELLVSPVGKATDALCEYAVGDSIRIVGPLGHGFTTDFKADSRVLLIGGGVGIAPLYYQLRALLDAGVKAEVVFGYRTTPDAEICNMFEALAPLHICTDDGSKGFHGLVTQHPAVRDGFTFFQVCGPKPMMKACARLADELGVGAEVSLENHMACGLGACLCCVEDTVDGNVCVCKNGPVFNIELLKWK